MKDTPVNHANKSIVGEIWGRQIYNELDRKIIDYKKNNMSSTGESPLIYIATIIIRFHSTLR
jgi:hypothetical protein